MKRIPNRMQTSSKIQIEKIHGRTQHSNSYMNEKILRCSNKSLLKDPNSNPF